MIEVQEELSYTTLCVMIVVRTVKYLLDQLLVNQYFVVIALIKKVEETMTVQIEEIHAVVIGEMIDHGHPTLVLVTQTSHD